MKAIEKELDSLIQKWACKQRSYVSYKPAECGHHYVHRNCKLLRWDIHNIIPLTIEEHTRHHSGLLNIEIRNPFREQYLINMKNKQFKDYLLENGLTEDEYLKKCKKTLLEVLN